MDSSLKKEREAFNKRLLASTEVKKAKPSPDVASRPKLKKPKSKLNKLLPNRKFRHLTGINEDITRAAEVAFRTDNPARLFKAVVDMMKERYLIKVFDPLGMEDILKIINLTELKKDRRDSLYQALKNNPKMHYYPEVDKFIYLPALGHSVRNREQLLRFLKEREKDGLGGLTMIEVIDSVPKSDKVIKKLSEDILRIPRGMKDKDEILFYNNKEYEMQIDEVFVSHWRSIGVEGQSEADVEKYLQNVGLSAMQGDSRKRKAAISKKSRKKSRQTKVLNTHLDLLQDYADDGTQMTTPSK